MVNKKSIKAKQQGTWPRNLGFHIDYLVVGGGGGGGLEVVEVELVDIELLVMDQVLYDSLFLNRRLFNHNWWWWSRCYWGSSGKWF